MFRVRKHACKFDYRFHGARARGKAALTGRSFRTDVVAVDVAYDFSSRQNPRRDILGRPRFIHYVD